MIKKIFISPYSMGYLSAFNAIDNIHHFKIYTPDIQFNTFFYSSLIQTGANFIEVISDPKKMLSRSETIKDRVLISNKDEYGKVSSRIDKIFSKYTNKKNKKLNKELDYAKLLITDLIYGARKGLDIIYTGKLPNLTKYSKILSPDLYYPLNTLINGIVSNNLFIASPISLIAKSDIKKFDAIINSDIYLNYSNAHTKLSFDQLKNAAVSIKETSEKLIASNSLSLSIYNNLTSIIPFSKLINPELGEIAQAANSMLTSISDANNRKNITIYMYKDVALKHVKDHVNILILTC